MLGKIWQSIVRWFRSLFGGTARSKLSSAAVGQAPPTLDDTDYEYLFMQLLEGIAHGWQQPRVVKFFEDLENRISDEQWLAWLGRFKERLLASSAPNNELGSRLVRLGEMGYGEIGETAYDTGMQLLTRGSSQAMPLAFSSPIVDEYDDSEVGMIEYAGADSLTATASDDEIIEYAGADSLTAAASDDGIIEYAGPDGIAPENPETGQVREISLDEFLVMLQEDPDLVKQVAEQLQIETSDPQEIVRAVIAQIQGDETTNDNGQMKDEG
ncbi:MAG: hypothetical protein KME17_26885 [Cyanosarcina radialis HA8281-LM2]|jgi:hypothetical protein|nr:hypothetical protein [Cyanosarcina radialis HA8281-LM2]